jgi:hypothetical protein
MNFLIVILCCWEFYPEILILYTCISCDELIARPLGSTVCKMIMKLKAEVRAQGGRTASKKN